MQNLMARSRYQMLRTGFLLLLILPPLTLLTYAYAYEIPENATKNRYGGGWTCNKGFSKSGNGCTEIQLPKNAVLDFSGNNWTCEQGFIKERKSCREMSTAEKTAADARRERLLAAIKAREAQIASGRHCETEYRSGAEVCLVITERNLECQKALLEDYYQSCEVEIGYRIDTTYRGRSSIETSFECSANLSSSGDRILGSYDTVSNRGQQTLYADDSRGGTLNLTFTFGLFANTTRVKLDSTKCRINDLSLY